MQENLVIVESPAKAKTIEKFLGEDYKVMSSYGHIRDLKKKELSIDPKTLEPDYEIPDEKKKLVSELKSNAKKAKKIWLASGVAQDDCLTVSFGLRYPNSADLFDNLEQSLCHTDLDVSELAIPFRLAPPVQNTGELTADSVKELKQQFLQQLAQSTQFDHLFQHALATTVSRRRYELLATEDIADLDDVRETFEQGGKLLQDNNCKLVYTTSPLRLYANGEWLDELSPAEAAILKHLADGKAVDYAFLCQLTDADNAVSLDVLFDSICNWLDDGWALLYE